MTNSNWRIPNFKCPTSTWRRSVLPGRPSHPSTTYPYIFHLAGPTQTPLYLAKLAHSGDGHPPVHHPISDGSDQRHHRGHCEVRDECQEAALVHLKEGSTSRAQGKERRGCRYQGQGSLMLGRTHGDTQGSIIPHEGSRGYFVFAIGVRTSSPRAISKYEGSQASRV